MIPMRAVSSNLNDIEDVAIEKSSGKWNAMMGMWYVWKSEKSFVAHGI